MGAQPPEPTVGSPEELSEPTEWYVSVAGQVFGPADRATLAQWAAEGRLTPNAVVAPLGVQQWSPISSVEELRDLPFPTPPAPTGVRYPPTSLPQRPPSAGTLGAPPPPAADEVAPCPRCGGSVANVAPAWGFFFGRLERSITPRLQCARCHSVLKIDELPEPARSKIIRTKRRSLVIWAVSTAVMTALFIWLGYKFGFLRLPTQ